MSGLSLRTIQRIESGNKASLESLKSLAAVFEIDISTLEQEIMTIDKELAFSYCAIASSLSAYFWGLLVRLSDKYSIWQTGS